MVRATGQLEPEGWVVLSRTFEAPADDVWAAVTEPGRLERWVGTWIGDPASGSVSFRMTAEGEDAPEERFTIEECRPPSVLRVTSGSAWELWIRLDEQAGGTTLRFGQRMTDPEMASSVGPGWEYYLDRLVAAESGRDVEQIRFDDYYPTLAAHYRSLLVGG